MNHNVVLDKKPLMIVIDDDKNILEIFSRFFDEVHGFEVLLAATQEAAIACIEGISRPAVVILDRFMVDEQNNRVFGEDILRILLERTTFPIVSIFHSADGSKEAHLNAIKNGADWYLVKPSDLDMLVAHVWRAVDRFKEPNVDFLSGALDRTGMYDRVIREMSHVERNGTTTACMFFDLDKLKLINDTHGHDLGDKMIASVAKSLSVHLRPTDVVCRWGGDEIIIFLFDIEEEDALMLAQTSCKATAEKIIYLDDEEHSKGHFYASVSVGVSILKPEEVIGAMQNLPDGVGKREAFMGILDSVIKIADKRMYEHKRAKNSGHSHKL